MRKKIHTFLLSLFAVNFRAFNFELEKVWGHFWIALETSYLKMPSKFPWLKIKGMKIDNKKTQQIRIIMRQSLSQTLWQIWIWTNSDMGTPAVELCENLSGILCTKEMYQTSCFFPRFPFFRLWEKTLGTLV